jgi:hypothetical protein
MKYLPTIAGILLGLLFLLASVPFLLGLVPEQPMPEMAQKFMAVFGPTGYMKFVKVLELIGGVLVAIPKTRNLGLLVLGPIIVNILAFTVFIMNGVGLANPMIAAVVILPLYLLWVERRAFAGLVK